MPWPAALAGIFSPKVEEEKKKQPESDSSQPEKETNIVHEDDESTSRIGRAGDLFKRRKV